MSSAGRGGGRAGFGAEPDQEDPVPERDGRKGKGDRLGLCLWPREGGGEGQGCSIHFDPSSLHLGCAELPARCQPAAPTPPVSRGGREAGKQGSRLAGGAGLPSEQTVSGKALCSSEEQSGL